MYAIENDLGRFEAETEKEAKQLLSKARRAYAKQEAADSAARLQARIYAESRAYAMLDRFVSGQKCAPAWILYRPGQYGYKVARIIDDYATTEQFIEVDTEDGRARLGVWQTKLTGVIIDGGGWAKAVELTSGNDTRIFAVGTYQNRLELAQLRIPAEWFPAGKS